jgi:hypothetical protein
LKGIAKSGKAGKKSAISIMISIEGFPRISIERFRGIPAGESVDFS